MARYYVSASYQTPSGGMSWRNREIDAVDGEAALAAMKKRIGRHAVRALDMRATLISPATDKGA